MEAFVQITRADGRSERHALAPDRTTIGTGPTATIRLDGEPSLAAEHVLLSPQGSSCWVSAAQGVHTVLVAGQPFESGFLPWNTELVIGATRVAIVVGQRDGDDVATDAPETDNKPSPVLMLALVGALAWVGLTVFGPDDAAGMSIGADAPALFAEQPPRCPDEDSPLHAAELAAEQAAAKSERYPFDPQDGVRAVALLRQSSACFRAADQGADADEVTREAELLERAINADYRASQLRLERALERADQDAARHEIYALLALVQHQRDGEFALALRDLQRQLQIEEKEVAE